MTATRVATDDKHWTHVQSVPTTDTVVTHNLGKYPSVTVVDSSGRELIVDVQHLSMTQTRVTTAAETSWTGYFN